MFGSRGAWMWDERRRCSGRCLLTPSKTVLRGEEGR